MTDRPREVLQLRAMDSKIGSCGCGQPYRHWDAIKGTLDAIKNNFEKKPNGEYECILERIQRRVSHEDLAYFALSMMDKFELCEHGSSLFGSFLTKTGEKVLSLLGEHDTDDGQWPDGCRWWDMNEPKNIDDIVWAIDFEGKEPLDAEYR